MGTRADCSSELGRFATKREARDAAVDLARAFTGRSAIIELSPPYTREGLTALVRTMAEACERIAAIVVEIGSDNDLVYGRFLKKARELASAEGAMLIWCETVVGRESGGLQAVYGIHADLTCLTSAESSWLCGKPEVIGHAAAA